MFHVIECYFELFLCLFTSPKCDLCKVEKAIFQVVEWHFELIFCPLTSQKFD